MPREVVMPRLSDTMSEGTVSKWRKQVGDAVSKGEIIAEIETDKATQDLESYDTGTLTQILVNEGETVALGTPIAIIAPPGEAGGTAPAPSQAPAQAAPSAQPTPAAAAQVQGQTPPPAPPASDETQAPAATAPAASTAPAAPATPATPATPAAPEAPAAMPAPSQDGHVVDEERIKISPVARRMAEEHGIDLHQLNGTGPDGRIVKEDIEGFLARTPTPPTPPTPDAPGVPGTPPFPAAPPTPPAPPVPGTPPPAPPTPTPPVVSEQPAPGAASAEGVEVFPLNQMQQTIARRMVQSRQQAPYFYVTTEIDMGEASRFRKSLNEALAGETSVSFNDLVLKACALTLRKFPVVNASWAETQLELHSHINIGFAAAMPADQGPGGLVVPVIRDVDQKSLRQIAIEAKALIERARAGSSRETDFSGATFSVSNMGMFDVDQFTAIINPPQSAILAVGSIMKKPVVKDDEIVVGERMRVTLSVDHRVFYGAMAAQFLQELKRILEHPLTMA